MINDLDKTAESTSNTVDAPASETHLATEKKQEPLGFNHRTLLKAVYELYIANPDNKIYVENVLEHAGIPKISHYKNVHRLLNELSINGKKSKYKLLVKISGNHISYKPNFNTTSFVVAQFCETYFTGVSAAYSNLESKGLINVNMPEQEANADRFVQHKPLDSYLLEQLYRYAAKNNTLKFKIKDFLDYLKNFSDVTKISITGSLKIIYGRLDKLTELGYLRYHKTGTADYDLVGKGYEIIVGSNLLKNILGIAYPSYIEAKRIYNKEFIDTIQSSSSTETSNNSQATNPIIQSHPLILENTPIIEPSSYMEIYNAPQLQTAIPESQPVIQNEQSSNTATYDNITDYNLHDFYFNLSLKTSLDSLKKYSSSFSQSQENITEINRNFNDSLEGSIKQFQQYDYLLSQTKEKSSTIDLIADNNNNSNFFTASNKRKLDSSTQNNISTKQQKTSATVNSEKNEISNTITPFEITNNNKVEKKIISPEYLQKLLAQYFENRDYEIQTNTATTDSSLAPRMITMAPSVSKKRKNIIYQQPTFRILILMKELMNKDLTESELIKIITIQKNEFNKAKDKRNYALQEHNFKELRNLKQQDSSIIRWHNSQEQRDDKKDQSIKQLANSEELKANTLENVYIRMKIAAYYTEKSEYRLAIAQLQLAYQMCRTLERRDIIKSDWHTNNALLIAGLLEWNIQLLCSDARKKIEPWFKRNKQYALGEIDPINEMHREDIVEAIKYEKHIEKLKLDLQYPEEREVKQTPSEIKAEIKKLELLKEQQEKENDIESTRLLKVHATINAAIIYEFFDNQESPIKLEQYIQKIFTCCDQLIRDRKTSISSSRNTIWDKTKDKKINKEPNVFYEDDSDEIAYYRSTITEGIPSLNELMKRSSAQTTNINSNQPLTTSNRQDHKRKQMNELKEAFQKQTEMEQTQAESVETISRTELSMS